MVTKIVKFLRKLSSKDRDVVEVLIISIKSKEWKHLDIKKLQGDSNIFRLRKGSIRILFAVKDGDVDIIDIQNRNDKTYSKL